MSNPTKDEKLFVRMPLALRQLIQQEARLRGESESVIVREALREYFKPQAEQAAFNERANSPLDRQTPHR